MRRSILQFCVAGSAPTTAPSEVTRESINAVTVPFNRGYRGLGPIPQGGLPSTSLAEIPTFDPKTMRKIITWNVASLRSLIQKDGTGQKAVRGTKTLTMDTPPPPTSAPGEKKKKPRSKPSNGLIFHDENPLFGLLAKEQPDVLCIQETKLSEETELNNHLIAPFSGYTFKDSISRERKGYSGTRTYVKDSSFSQGDGDSKWWKGLDYGEPSQEHSAGRVLTGQWKFENGDQTTSPHPHGPMLTDLTVTNTYVVNGGDKMQRLDYKINDFNPSLVAFLNKLQEERSLLPTSPTATPPIPAPAPKKKGRGRKKKEETATLPTEPVQPISQPSADTSLVLWTGDINCAPQDWDRFWDRAMEIMEQDSGFSPPEKASLKATLADLKMVDTFRALYPNSRDTYTFWNYYGNERLRNRGWRIDGFMVPQKDMWRVVDVFPLKEVMGSDHCPVVMWLWK